MKKPTTISTSVALTPEQAKYYGDLLKVSASKVRQVADKGLVGWKLMDPDAAHEMGFFGPAIMEVVRPKPGKGPRAGNSAEEWDISTKTVGQEHAHRPFDIDVQQVKDGLQIIDTYKKAGYDISGVTSDGVVIVEPAGKPDNFSLAQLGQALAKVRTKY